MARGDKKPGPFYFMAPIRHIKCVIKSAIFDAGVRRIEERKSDKFSTVILLTIALITSPNVSLQEQRILRLPENWVDLFVLKVFKRWGAVETQIVLKISSMLPM
jgi:hypothetical protein